MGANRRQGPDFRAIDGMNCPNLPAGIRHRIRFCSNADCSDLLPWPPKAADGTPIDPEFTLEVVRDPGGCNSIRNTGSTVRTR